jgi:hypothetical protein
MEKFHSSEPAQPKPESFLKEKISKVARSVVAGTMLGVSTLGSVEAQENTTPVAVENTISESPQGDALEGLRNERVKILRSEIEEKIAILESYHDREKFNEYYTVQKKEEDRQVELGRLEQQSRLFNEIKESIKTLTEDEVRLVTNSVLVMDALTKEYQRSDKEEDSREKFMNGLENFHRFIKQHPRVEAVAQYGGTLDVWLRDNTQWFIDSYNSINPFDKLETAKRPSEIFNKVFDNISDGQRQYLDTWIDETYSQEKLDVLWKNRPSEELLRLQIDFEKHELDNIQTNLKEALVAQYIDTARMEVLEYICSPGYVKKLVEKEGMTVEQANEMQMMRFESVSNVEYSIDNRYEGGSSVSVRDSSVVMNLNAYDVAHYPKTNPQHEFVHVALRGDKYITDFERKIYEAAGISKEEYAQITKDPVGMMNDIEFDQWTRKIPKALVSPAELAPRKLVLEFEMERLGIKKRFEEMTHEHYLQVVELVRSGKLKHNSAQIILTTTEEGLLSIMNSLAFEDTSKKNSTPIA